jgi:FAD/FMN-containing dehydrogenase
LRDAVLAQSGEQSRDLWRIRETIPEAQFTNVKHDISLPVSKIPEFIERAGREPARALRRHRHLLLRPRGRRQPPLQHRLRALMPRREEVNRVVYDTLEPFGGSISASMASGSSSARRSGGTSIPLELELMRGLKHALDPRDC